MDEDTHRVLQKLKMKQLNLVPVAALENEMLLKLKETRDQSEYCWTMKPIFLQAVLNSNPELERVTYIDGDLFSTLIRRRFLKTSRTVRCCFHEVIS